MVIKTVEFDLIVEKISELCLTTNLKLEKNFKKKLQNFLELKNDSKLNQLYSFYFKNEKIAIKKKLPICQDTGYATFFVEYGNNVVLDKSNITNAINQGVKKGYKKYYLRKSILKNPFNRSSNTKDNTPAFIHIDNVSGNKIKIYFLPKGGGSENLTVLKSFTPGTDEKEIINFIYDTVKNAGSKGCPPYKLGIAIGGTFDYCVFLSKKALIDKFANNTKIEKSLSEQILKKTNSLKIGFNGLGKGPTVVDVNTIIYPTHIATMPVSITFNCNAMRLGYVSI